MYPAPESAQILLYHLDTSSDDGLAPSYSLKKVAEWNHNYMVTSLGTFDDRIVAGDQISSVSLLKVAGDELISEARDYGPLYPVAVEALNSKSLICANVGFNSHSAFHDAH
jgi:DNA damage-binding protein 1